MLRMDGTQDGKDEDPASNTTGDDEDIEELGVDRDHAKERVDGDDATDEADATDQADATPTTTATTKPPARPSRPPTPKVISSAACG
jgi:hypothetical protein